MDADKFLDLTKKVDKLRQAKDRAAGSLESLKTQLKKEFGIDSIKEAKKIQADLNMQGAKVSEELEQLIEQFEEAQNGRL